MTFFRVAKKLTNIWATFKRQFVAKNFRKSPNLVTLVLSSQEATSFILSITYNNELSDTCLLHPPRLDVGCTVQGQQSFGNAPDNTNCTAVANLINNLRL